MRQELWDSAAARFEEDLAYWREIGEPVPIGMVLMHLGGVAFGQGDLTRARALVGEAAALFRGAGDYTWLATTDWYLGMIAAAEGRFPESARRYRESLRGLVEAGDASFFHRPLPGLAVMAIEAGRPETAVQLLGAVDARLQRTGTGLPPFHRKAYEQADAGARAALGEAGFAAAHAVGSDLDQDAWLAAADLVVAAVEEMAARAPRRHGGEPAGLTPREVEVLVLIADGLSDREAAAALFVSQGTVRSHVTSIFGKLGVGSRTAAIAAARHLGIL